MATPHIQTLGDAVGERCDFVRPESRLLGFSCWRLDPHVVALGPIWEMTTDTWDCKLDQDHLSVVHPQTHHPYVKGPRDEATETPHWSLL